MSKNPYGEAARKRPRGYVRGSPSERPEYYANQHPLPYRDAFDYSSQSHRLSPNQANQQGFNNVSREYDDAAQYTVDQEMEITGSGDATLDPTHMSGFRDATPRYYEASLQQELSSQSATWGQYLPADYEPHAIQGTYVSESQTANEGEESCLHEPVIDGHVENHGANHEPEQADTRSPQDTQHSTGSDGRICCPYIIKEPHLPPVSTACWSTGFPNVSRLKQHLKRNHGVDLPFQDRDKSEVEKFENIWRQIFPDFTGRIPTPYGWDREALQRRQNLRVIEEHDEYIRVQLSQRSCPQLGSVLEDILATFHHLRRNDLLPD